MADEGQLFGVHVANGNNTTITSPLSHYPYTTTALICPNLTPYIPYRRKFSRDENFVNFTRKFPLVKI